MSTIRLLFVSAVLCLSAAAAASPDGKTGASGKDHGQICMECHSGGKVPRVELSGPLELALGERATYAFTIHGGSGVVGGFDIAVDDPSAQLLAKSDTTLGESGELTHARPLKFANGALTVSFDLVAPGEGGEVTLYAAGNSCDGDKTKRGDAASATSLTIMLTPATEAPGPGDPVKQPRGCAVGGGAQAPGTLIALIGLVLLARTRRSLLWACLFSIGCNQDPLPAGGQPVNQAENVCKGGKEWSVRVSGTALDRFEGKSVWVSAVEPRQDATDEVAVFLQGKITNGSVSLSCDRGLSTNYWYPSFSVAIDANGDGRCNDGDVHMTDQYYGWN